MAQFTYVDGKLIRQTGGSGTIDFIYSAGGVIGFKFAGTTYIYRRNLMGDVTHIYTTDGAGGGGASGFSGRLENGYNRSRDVKLNIAQEMIKIGDKTKDEVNNIIKNNEYYTNHDKPKYAAIPGKNSQKYNCNSFTRGLLEASGINCTNLKPKKNVPGWNKPLPKSYFGIDE